ncbi:MAG: radical SAM protein [Thermodesulfovibrionales bacterium]|nr:radical SAM protein [Thermodesulfovibrionales bacterium]
MAHKSSEKRDTDHGSRLAPSGLSDKIREAETILKKCELCPRKCHVNRTAGQKGFCRTGDKPFVASWGPHYGEERPLVGRHGSGTIFFGHCNLGCIFCQNYSISHLGEGQEISFEKLASVMLELQDAGCHNINLVTPTHQVPMILRAYEIAKGKGLSIPIVYNCGGYESLHIIELLEGIVAIYMPDFKYFDPEMALLYSAARDYPETAMTVIKEMHRQVGDLQIDERGVAVRGLLVRHLVLPEGIAGTKGVVRFIAEEISKNTYINIMNQYHPCFRAFETPPLNRNITDREYKDAVRMAIDAGLKRIDGITT